MTWLVDARNVIVKEGDLSTSSKLRLAVVETWFAPPYIELDAPPLIETEEFLKFLAERTEGSIDLKVRLLRAERRWIDEQLADSELLEALSYAFGVLSNLLLDAHEKLCYQASLLNCVWYTHQIPSRGQRPSCMKALEWERTVWLDLHTGEIMRPLNIPVRIIDDEEVINHYPDLRKPAHDRKTPASLKEEVDMLFEGAKSILCVDGSHVPAAILGYPDGHRDIVGLQMLNRTEKHLVIRTLAAEVEKSGATSIVLIGEVWVSNTDEYRLTPVGVESPTLREALRLDAINANGETYCREVFFTRDEDGKVNLGKESSASLSEVNILNPIREVWNKGCAAN